MTDTLPDFRTFTHHVRLKGILQTQSALRVGAGRSYEVLGDDITVVKDTLERPVIPGSSLKGALRAHTERLLRTLEPMVGASNLACDPLTKPCITKEEVQEIKGQREADSQLQQKSCWACRLFGAPWLAAKVLIRDLPVCEETWIGQFTHRDGVSIARDKGTAQAKHRYTLETVPTGTAFSFALVLDSAAGVELGLLLLTLESLERGLIQIGAARSRGLGNVTLDINWDQVIEITPPQAIAALGNWALGKELPTTTWTRKQRDAWTTAFFQAIGLPQNEIDRWNKSQQQTEVVHEE